MLARSAIIVTITLITGCASDPPQPDACAPVTVCDGCDPCTHDELTSNGCAHVALGPAFGCEVES